MRWNRVDVALGAVLALMVVGAGACGSSSSNSASNLPTSIGAGEGQLNRPASNLFAYRHRPVPS